jgi:CTP synthase (UTP-ammonia lyase)
MNVSLTNTQRLLKPIKANTYRNATVTATNNNDYKQEYEKAGMKCVGINPESDLVEIIEIPTLKWFIGVQFHPEYSSTVLKPHPLFLSFIKAAIDK